MEYTDKYFESFEHDEENFDENFDDNFDENDAIVVPKKKDENRFFYNDWLYVKTLTQLELATKHNNLMDTHCYYFAYKRETKYYELILPENIDVIKNKRFLYEIINSESAIRLPVDIDVDKEDPKPFSLYQVKQMIENFRIYLKEKYDYTHNFTYNIHISIHPDHVNNTYTLYEKNLSSCHIIFDIIVTSSKEAKEVVTNFVYERNVLTDLIDLSVYSYRKKFRTLYQSKEQTKKNEPVSGNTLYKFEEQILSNTFKHNPTITSKDLISIVIPTNTPEEQLLNINNKKILLIDEHKILKNIKIDPPVITLKYENFNNVFYHIDQIDKVKKYFLKLADDVFNKESVWYNNVRLIIATLILANIDWNNILTHELTNYFLNRTTYPNYTLEESNKWSIDYFQKLIDKKVLFCHYNAKFFDTLTPKEILYIFKILNLEQNATILITEKKINKQQNLLITHGDGLSIDIILTKIINPKDNTHNFKESLYILKHQILLVDFIIKIENKTNVTNLDDDENIIDNNDANIDDKKNELIEVIYSNNQYQVSLEEIKHIGNKNKKHCYPVTYITNLKAFDIKVNENIYLTAPVGSGKSYHILSKDIKHILKTNKKIMMITDTRSMADKTYSDVIEILTKLKIDKSIVKLYKDCSEFSKDTRILICCYNSIANWKDRFYPDFLLIDEICNVAKSISSTNLTGAKKDDTRNYFFHLISTCVLKFYDADVDEFLLQIIKKNYNIPIKIVSLINYVQYNNNIILTTESNNLLEIESCIKSKQKITISSTTGSKKMIELIDVLTEKYPHLNIVFIHKKGAEVNKASLNPDTNDTNGLKFLSILCSNTELWKKFDIVIYSPSITTGVSFNDKTYFFKHFHFIDVSTADATQCAQMVNRVRGNLSKTIQISISKNALGTLKKYKILDTSKQRLYNFEVFNDNVIHNTDIELKKITEIELLTTNTNKTEYDIINTSHSIQNSIILIEDWAERQKKYRLAYDLFQLLFKYGSTNLSIHFFQKYEEELALTDEKIKNELINEKWDTLRLKLIKKYFFYKELFLFKKKLKNVMEQLILLYNDEHKMLATGLYHKTKLDYENAIYIKDFTSKTDEFDYDKDKTSKLSKLNYTQSIWGFYYNLKQIYHLLVKIQLKRKNIYYRIIIIELINEIKNIISKYTEFNYTIINNIQNFVSYFETNKIINESILSDLLKNLHNNERNLIDRIYDTTNTDMYGNSIECTIYNHNAKFYKTSNISYYEVKYLIYLLYENIFTGKIDNQKLNNDLFHQKDLTRFIEFIYGLFVSFKLFDIIGVTQSQIEGLYLNQFDSKVGLKINKLQHKIQFDELIKTTQPIFHFLLNLTNIPVFKKDAQTRQPFSIALSKLNLDFDVGKSEDTHYYISVKPKSFFYRFQKYRLRLPTSKINNQLIVTELNAETNNNIQLINTELYSENNNNIQLIVTELYSENNTTDLTMVFKFMADLNNEILNEKIPKTDEEEELEIDEEELEIDEEDSEIDEEEPEIEHDDSSPIEYDLTYNENELDDVYYHLHNETCITLLKDIPIKILPKILRYKSSFYKPDIDDRTRPPQNRTANASYLYYCIKHFCNPNKINKLMYLLTQTQKIINKKYIDAYTLNKDSLKFDNDLNALHDILKDRESELGKIKEIKSEKVQKNKEEREEKVECDICGGKYDTKHYNKHCETAKHKLALTDVTTITHKQAKDEKTTQNKEDREEKVECDICGGKYVKRNYKNHCETAKHIKMSKSRNM